MRWWRWGVLISFRILDFPDLTADGSFPLGGAVAAVCIVNGINPWLACAAGMAAGACAVWYAWLHGVVENFTAFGQHFGDGGALFGQPQNHGLHPMCLYR